MPDGKSEVLQGTLDLMVLKTLESMGPLHGYGIARRIEQVSEDVLQLNQGTIYASLVRLQQKRWISAGWGTSHVTSLVFVLVLTLTLMCSSAYAQSAPPSGTFGYLINASYTEPSNKPGFALIGLMTFDGAGSVTGSYTSEPQNTPQPRTGALTGTYTANPDGTGSMNIADDTGTKFTFATVTVDGGQGIQLLVTGCSGGLLVLPNGCSIGGTTQISGIARVVYTGPLQGSYGTEITISPQGAIGVGATNLDGAGNLTISSTYVFLSGTEGQPGLFTLTDTGTYSLNSDGTGTVTLAAMPGQGVQTFTIVTTDNGSGLMLLQVNRSGNGVSFGTARLQ